MFKKSLLGLLLVSPLLRGEQESQEEVLRGKKKCGSYNTLTVCNNTKTGSLTVTGNGTVSGSLAVGGPLTVGGTTVLTALRSYGQAYATALQATSGNITFAGGGSTFSGITVAGPDVTLTNAGIYYVRYSVLFTQGTEPEGEDFTSSIVISVGGTPIAAGTAGYIQSVSFATGTTSGPVTGSTLELSGGVFITTAAASQVLTVAVTLGADTTLAVTTAPAANATLEIIQIN